MPAKSPPVGLPSKATGLPGIMFATLGVGPAGLLGPNPYHPSHKITNILQDQISTPLLWAIWFLLPLNKFVLKSITNAYNEDLVPL